MSKNIKKLLILAGVIIAIVVLIFADKSFKEKQLEKQGTSETETTEPIENVLDDKTSKDKESEKKADESKDSIDNTDEYKSDSAEQSDKENKKDDTDSTKADDNSVKSDDDVSYEEWLAAGVVTAISMHYMDFDIDSIYLLSENSMADKDESKGVYVVFESDEKDVVIHSAPLAEERSYPGTIDFSTQNFGLASFDEVEVNEAELRKATEIELDEIIELVSQLMLVTVYEH